MSQSPEYWRGAHDCCLTVKSLIRRQRKVSNQRALGEILAEIELETKSRGEEPRWKGVRDCIKLAQNFQRQANPSQTLEQFLSGVQGKAEEKAEILLATIIGELNITLDETPEIAAVEENPLAEALGFAPAAASPAPRVPESTPSVPAQPAPVPAPRPVPVVPPKPKPALSAPEPIAKPASSPTTPAQPVPRPQPMTGPPASDDSETDEDVLSSSLKAALKMLREEEGEE